MATAPSMIYVIDDDLSVHTTFGRLLPSANLNIEEFSSAEEFLSSPKQKDNACIILNIQMSGLAGIDLMERLASEGIRIPVIAISVHNDMETREKAKELGTVSFYHKPIDGQALLVAVRRSLDKGGKKSDLDMEALCSYGACRSCCRS